VQRRKKTRTHENLQKFDQGCCFGRVAMMMMDKALKKRQKQKRKGRKKKKREREEKNIKRGTNVLGGEGLVTGS